MVGARIPAMADLNNYLPVIDIAGAVASVVGLGFTIYVLIVAKGVKKQVEEAKALARKRNLVEELNDASQKLEQIGNFLQQRQWVGVQIRTAEVLTDLPRSHGAMVRSSFRGTQERCFHGYDTGADYCYTVGRDRSARTYAAREQGTSSCAPKGFRTY